MIPVMANNEQGRTAGRLGAIRRYPVKSLAGELRDHALVDLRGLQGDRLWSVRDPDGKLGSGKSSRRFRRMDGLLELTAAYDGEVPVIGFPDGSVVRGDDDAVHAELSGHVGRPVRLAREQDVPHFDDGPVHLVTTASLRQVERAYGRPVDPVRLRPNLLLDVPGDGFVEDSWVGREVSIGSDVVLAVRMRMPRCVMVDVPQPGVTVDGRLLQTVSDLNDSCLGVLADVVRGGTIRVGDGATLVG
jgi:uncharacterized protein YcbX